MSEKMMAEIALAKKDISVLAESLLEHISSLDEQMDDIVSAVTEGIETKIREIVREELLNGEKAETTTVR